MPEDFPGFSVDSDWKKQAQEEKRRLAEEAQRQKAAPAAITPEAPAAQVVGGQRSPVGPGAAPSPAGRQRRPRREEIPEANFTTLVQTMAGQVLMYLGGVALSSGEAMVDLDTAKHQIDLLAVLEQTTRNNLTPQEQKAMDVALYETRMRFVSVASRYIL
jgi:hypothetical protein